VSVLSLRVRVRCVCRECRIMRSLTAGPTVITGKLMHQLIGVSLEQELVIVVTRFKCASLIGRNDCRLMAAGGIDFVC